jgi:two-component system, cell cycle sensor histidine kinase and response regulator CckA
MFKDIQWYRTDTLFLPLRQFGPWFWVHTSYSYALMLLGFLFLARTFIDFQRIYRRQTLSLLFAALAPWLCNILFLSGTPALPKLDLTPFAFTVSGLAIMWGILRYRLLDVVPVARDIVIQNMRDGILVLDNEDRILDLNQTALDLIGEQQSLLIGRYVNQAIQWWPRLPSTAGSNGLEQPFVIDIPHNNLPRYLQISASALHHKGKSLGRLIILQDITELKENQDAIRRSEDRFKAISENAPVIILSTDESGIITYVNPSWRNILGHSREEVVGRPFTDFVADWPAESYADLLDRIVSGRERVVEGHVAFNHKRAGLHMFNFTASVNSDSEGRITGIICVAKDVTEEERLRTQLFQSQKMEAIGTLAGGIAHDFNNLLMGVQANISLLRLENEGSEALQEKLRRIEDQIQSGASLTRQLLGYARKGKYVVAPLDIRGPINDVLQMIQRTHKLVRVHHLRPTEDACIMEADQGQMELAILNLFVNAADAMPEGGDLTVVTERVRHTELVDQWPELQPGHYIRISITDTGIGMDQSTLERIFEPFFTTKEIGRGTGLGLASVYGVVKNHGGHIQVQSQPGHGSTFIVLFPAAPLTKLPQTSLQPGTANVLRGGYILLADSEPHIREYIAQMIQSLGFIVLTAGNGQEALNLFEKSHHFIDGIILDIHLPGWGGGELLERLREIESEIQAIFIGGPALQEQVGDLLSHGHLLLNKPFTREELALAITKIVEGKDLSLILDQGQLPKSIKN